MSVFFSSVFRSDTVINVPFGRVSVVQRGLEKLEKLLCVLFLKKPDEGFLVSSQSFLRMTIVLSFCSALPPYDVSSCSRAVLLFRFLVSFCRSYVCRFFPYYVLGALGRIQRNRITVGSTVPLSRFSLPPRPSS